MNNKEEEIHLHVLVMEARNLKAVDNGGTSDPYVKFHTGKNNKKGSGKNLNFFGSTREMLKEKSKIFQKKLHKETNRTSVKKKTLNPVWDEMINLHHVNKHDKLSVIVQDWNALTAPVFLGEIEIELSTLKIGEHLEKVWELTGAPNEKITGTIRLLLCLSHHQEIPRMEPNGSMIGFGRLNIILREGRDLAPKDSNGLSDPYCVVDFENRSKKTQVVYKSLNPHWDRDFVFDVCDTSSILKICLWDEDLLDDDPMGKIEISINDLQDEKRHEGWYQVCPQVKENVKGDVYAIFQYTSALRCQKNFLIAEKNMDFFTNVFTAHNFTLFTALLRIDDNMDLLNSALRFLNAEKLFLKFLQILIEKEIFENTTSEQQIFRQNTVTTKLIVSFLRRFAFDYLKDTILPTIELISSAPNGFELNPNKLPKGEKLEDNLKKVNCIVEKCFVDIINSKNKLPSNVGKLLSMVESIVKKKFPNASIKSVGAVIFLRFFVPAISIPDNFFEFSEKLSVEERRAVTLVAKIIQNVANGVLFEGKEIYMEPFNGWLQKNQPTLNQFLVAISKPDFLRMDDVGEIMSVKQKTQEISTIIKYIQPVFPDLLKFCKQNPIFENNSDLMLEFIKDFLNLKKLCEE